MSEFDRFRTSFRALTGNEPFPWQCTLYDKFCCGDFPGSCQLPTGLGKTSIIALWLLALADQPHRVPRRLVYVVNRRTVVDQTTNEVENYRRQLTRPDLADLQQRLQELCAFPLEPQDSPLAISTLRGQFVDNAAWSADPLRPAVICGTVDMIGSRLLFSGYGLGFRTRPLHAGFLGQDALLIHDEAHLEPAFQTLVTAIEREQSAGERVGELSWPKLRVLELTATSRTTGSSPDANSFGLSAEDRKQKLVSKRLNAHKKLYLHGVADEKKLADDIVKLASTRFQKSGDAILIFVSQVDTVEKITKRLPAGTWIPLTGTMRGYERETEMLRSPIFQRFLPPSNRDPSITPQEGTVYLVCTSAGEVGVNLSADQMLSDLSPFDSMAQRLGRLNRFGERDDSEVHVLYPTVFDEKRPLLVERQRTLAVLQELVDHAEGDVSPHSLSKIDAATREGAFTPAPAILPTSDILFDAWAMTTITEKLPGRPPVEPYLHGVAEWQPPETQLAWREEVSRLEPLRKSMEPDEYVNFVSALLDDYPLKPFERLTDRVDRVVKQLKLMADRKPEAPVWLIDDQQQLSVSTLQQLLEGDPKTLLEGATVLLAPETGGLRHGLLAGDSDAPVPDVSGQWFDEQNRPRRWRGENDQPCPIPGMRLIQSIHLEPESEDETNAPDRSWNWYVLQADADWSRWATGDLAWETHVHDVEARVRAIVSKSRLSDELQTALLLAAEYHDHGKRRERFQKVVLGNSSYPKTILAKSKRRQNRRDVPEKYRHELGSLTDFLRDTKGLSEELCEIVLHLIAAHHGRARPHFPAEEVFDPESPEAHVEQLATEVPRRYARLQRRYGRWGLAYLESLLRAADYAASAHPSASAQTGGNP